MTCIYAARGSCDGPPDYRIVHRDAAGLLLAVDQPVCWAHALEEVTRHGVSAGGRSYFEPLDNPGPAVRYATGAGGVVRLS